MCVCLSVSLSGAGVGTAGRDTPGTGAGCDNVWSCSRWQEHGACPAAGGSGVWEEEAAAGPQKATDASEFELYPVDSGEATEEC